MITPEQHAEIRRLYFGEHWKVGTIAAALGVHHDTVRAAIAHDTRAVRRGTLPRRRSSIRICPFIRDTLAQYPRLRATRLFEMVRARGYPGSVVQLRRVVRTDPARRRRRRVYRRLTTLAGGRGADRLGRLWHDPDRPRRPPALRLRDGALVLARRLRALHRSIRRSRVFCAATSRPSRRLQGVARTLVYDNLRSAVLERAGTAIRFHPRLLELAGHYHFAPRPCTPGRANEKGKVERQIQYLRHAFFAARTFADVDDLNAQFRRWRDEIAHQRPHPEQRDQTVAEVFAEEQPRLLPLPGASLRRPT